MTDHRDRIIVGLAQVFENDNKPLNSVTIADICAAAKVSKRTFYEFFNNKEDCFLALYEKNSFRILAQVIESTKKLNSNEASITEIMQSILNSYFDEILTRPNLMARLYIDILAIDQKGIELRYLILKNYAIGIKGALFEKLEKISLTEVLLFLSGVNELVLYHLHHSEYIEMDDLKKSVQKIILMFFG